MLKSKIHRAWVTDANPDYVGSILIDEELMKRVDLWEFEKVLVCDVTNGNRFETYAPRGAPRVRSDLGPGRRGTAERQG